MPWLDSPGELELPIVQRGTTHGAPRPYMYEMRKSFISLLLLCSPGLLAQGRWVEVGRMIRPRVDHTATVLQDGTVLIAGGRDSSGAIAGAEIFDPKTNSFVPAGTMIHPRYGHTAILVDDGTVFIAGGYPAIGPSLLTTEIFDPLHHAFVDGPVMLAGASTIGAVNGTPFMCTGCLTGCQTYQKPFLTPPFFALWPKGGSALANLRDGSVLVAGGNVCGTKGNYSTSDVYRIDPAWHVHAVATPDGFYNGRENATATRYDATHVLIAGGLRIAPSFCPPDACGVHWLASSRIYDASAEAVTIGPTMSTARRSHVAAKQPDGNVLVAGGRGESDTPLTSVEIFDPRSNTFRPGPDLPAMRVDAPLVTLFDGRLFIVGGSQGTLDKLHFDGVIYEPDVLLRHRSVRH